MMRKSIEPTYDSRKTGNRYSVEYSINGISLSKTSIADPFIRGAVHIGWRDLLRCLFRFRKTTVEICVRGDAEIEEDILELDGNYLGLHSSTRRKEFQAKLEESLSDFAEVCE
jgi:hypothetical protein